MRFHVLALPHTQTTWEYVSCAYTAKIIGFCRMMKERGHTVFLYSGEKNEALCDEHIVCIDEKSRQEACGGGHYTSAPFGQQYTHWQFYNTEAIMQIRERVQPQDFLCVIAGTAHQPVADMFPAMTCVEWGVGYSGIFAKHRIFESYAWMHMHYGWAACRGGGDVGGVKGDGNFTDAVIPGYIDPDMFPFKEQKDDYFLFVGRLIERKGLKIAQDVCQYLGKKLVVCGAGDFSGYGEYLGVVDPTWRGILMSGAKALFAPTRYVEPFGNVAVEAQACGTPVISTDWGAFTETVVNGYTGYRCRTFGEFVDAARRCDQNELEPTYIRHHAISNYSLPVIGEQFERHFKRLYRLSTDGWASTATWDDEPWLGVEQQRLYGHEVATKE